MINVLHLEGLRDRLLDRLHREAFDRREMERLGLVLSDEVMKYNDDPATPGAGSEVSFIMGWLDGILMLYGSNKNAV